MDDLELVPELKKKGKKSKAEIELDKMLAEARAAEAKLAEKEASKPKIELVVAKPQAEEPKQPAEKSDFLKWFFIGLIVVSIVGGYFIYTHMHPNTNFVNNPTTGLAVYNPEKLLAGWTLDVSRTNLAEMPTDIRAEMLSQ